MVSTRSVDKNHVVSRYGQLCEYWRIAVKNARLLVQMKF